MVKCIADYIYIATIKMRGINCFRQLKILDATTFLLLIVAFASDDKYLVAFVFTWSVNVHANVYLHLNLLASHLYRNAVIVSLSENVIA